MIIKTLKGYTTQARYYASEMGMRLGSEDEWDQAGWTKLANGRVKPVYVLRDGRQVVLLDGNNHLTVLVCAVETPVFVDEEDCYKNEVR